MRTSSWRIGLVVLILSRASPLRAAELVWTSPPNCERASTIEQTVETLTGRPFAGSSELIFQVRVTSKADTWHLRLSAGSRDNPSRSERAFDGKTCVEVTDAAAVAIAMAIQNDGAPEAPVAVPQEPPPEPEAPAVPLNVRTEPRDPVPAPPAERPLSAVVAAGGGVDTAALPVPVVGFTASAGARWRGVRVEAQGWLFPSRTVALTQGRTARFDLLVGAVLACAEHEISHMIALGCGGFELGRISGEGQAISDPHLGSALWEAARVELGAEVPAGAGLRLTARLGIAAPLSRPEFQLDGANVHRPSALTLRAAIGAEISP